MVNDMTDTTVSDERLEYLRERVEEAQANGDPDKYVAFITVRQAHEIGQALTELQRHRKEPANEPAEWHLGAQNDGLFIIDTPPRPSNDDQWHDRPDGPNLVIPLGNMSKDVAQKIVDAHNAALRIQPVNEPAQVWIDGNTLALVDRLKAAAAHCDMLDASYAATACRESAAALTKQEGSATHSGGEVTDLPNEPTDAMRSAVMDVLLNTGNIYTQGGEETIVVETYVVRDIYDAILSALKAGA